MYKYIFPIALLLITSCFYKNRQHNNILSRLTDKEPKSLPEKLAHEIKIKTQKLKNAKNEEFMAEQQCKQKDQVIEQKDQVISQVKDENAKVKQESKQKDQVIEQKDQVIQQKDDQITKLKEKLKSLGLDPNNI